MYNNNGNYSGDPKYSSSGNYTNIGGFRVKPIYLYAAVAVIILLALYFVTRFLNTNLVIHFGVFAGALLLLTNLRELLGQSYAQRSSTALLNCLIGAALVCAWLSQIVNLLFWVPAIALIAVATPLAFGRSSVYSTYVQTARSAVSNVRRGMGR